MSNYPAGVSGQTIDDYFGDSIEDVIAPSDMDDLLALEKGLENAQSRFRRLERIMEKFGERAEVLSERYWELDGEIIPEIRKEISRYYDQAGLEAPF